MNQTPKNRRKIVNHNRCEIMNHPPKNRRKIMNQPPQDRRKIVNQNRCEIANHPLLFFFANLSVLYACAPRMGHWAEPGEIRPIGYGADITESRQNC